VTLSAEYLSVPENVELTFDPFLKFPVKVYQTNIDRTSPLSLSLSR
jgi:hypothetical protein